jgi:hypothetical protein
MKKIISNTIDLKVFSMKSYELSVGKFSMKILLGNSSQDINRKKGLLLKKLYWDGKFKLLNLEK